MAESDGEVEFFGEAAAPAAAPAAAETYDDEFDMDEPLSGRVVRVGCV